jgi:hypothetical protein
MKSCYACGAPGEILVDDGASAICEPCEISYQMRLAAEYPFGMCQTCGAAYQRFECPQGRWHFWAAHVEGACGQWADRGDGEPVGPMSAALGYCTDGCRPEFGIAAAYAATAVFAYRQWWEARYAAVSRTPMAVWAPDVYDLPF